MAGILEDRPTEIDIEISSPEQEFMALRLEKLMKYPNIQAVEQFLRIASVMNQTQQKLGEDAMKLANVSWETAKGIDSAAEFQPKYTKPSYRNRPEFEKSSEP